MSTRMDGIHQPSLFSGSTLRMDVLVARSNRYRVLAEKLPWLELAEVANRHRSKVVNINSGRPLDLRLHLGAFIAQSMNGWTDRDTEEMVLLNAGVRLLCGLEQSTDSIDHTSIATFRGQLGPLGAEALNAVMVRAAVQEGFTDTRLCSSDTTVQEAPICYPTEVGHLKKISEKLKGIGSRIRQGVAEKLGKLAKAAGRTFTEIRLFTRGQGEQALERKRALTQDLQRTVARMERLLREEISHLGDGARAKYQDSLDLYRKMLAQIRCWIRTGYHPEGKIVSLWLSDVRAIARNKAGKATEFGRRWIVTRLTSGYMIATVCAKLGGGADTSLMPEVLAHFEGVLGEMPKVVVYDRGGDGSKNHRTLKMHEIKNCIFRKGKESQPGLGKNTARMARRERALSEAAIATIKNPRYGFNKPRARSGEGCILKGQTAVMGANLKRLSRDWLKAAT